jgi:hypothetical protein
MRLYHMTPNDITEFSASPENRSGPVVFLSPYADFQPAYHQAAELNDRGKFTSTFKEGANVMPVYADVRNPLVLDHPRKIKEAAAKYQGGDRKFPRIITPEAKAAMEADGFDAIIFGGDNPIPYGDRPMDARLGHQEARDEEFIIFDPGKIKSATGNRGTYDMTTPNITKALGGAIEDDDDDIYHAVRLSRDLGGATNENPQVMMTDANGVQYDATGKVVQPVEGSDKSNSAAMATPAPTEQAMGVAPQNYETDVKPLIDYAVTPIDREGMPSEPDLVDVMRVATQVAAEGQPSDTRGEGNLGRRRTEAVRSFMGASPEGYASDYKGPFSYNASDMADYANTLLDFSPVALGEIAHDIPYEAGRTGDYGAAAVEGGVNALMTAPVIGGVARGVKKGYDYLKRSPALMAGAAGMAGLTAGSEEAEAGPARWFSKAMEVAGALPMEKMTGQQALAMLRKGTSPEELKWTGAEKFLSSRPQVSKSELVEYLNNNRLQTNDVVLGGTKPVRRDDVVPSETAIASMKGRWDELREKNRLLTDEYYSLPYELQVERKAEFYERQYEIEREKDALHAKMINDTIEEMGGLGVPVKYGLGSTNEEKYVTPGGEDYSETLFTIPDSTGKTIKEYQVYGAFPRKFPTETEANKYVDQLNSMMDNPGFASIATSLRQYPPSVGPIYNPNESFISTHWDGRPNIAAHVRSQIFESTPPGSNRPYKVFNVDEAQSDWAKSGRDEGFVTFEDKQNFQNLVKQYDDLNKQRRDIEKIVSTGDDASPEVQEAVKNLTDMNNRMHNLSETMTRIRSGGVPIGPYVSSTQGWTDLSIKKSIDKALDSGADYFSFTPGEVQAQRYSLRNLVDEIQYDPVHRVLFGRKGGEKIIEKDNIEPEELRKYIGKEMTERLLSQPAKESKWYANPRHVLSDQQLELGGEGMIDYYNNIYKKRVEKVVKDATGKKVEWEVIPINTKRGVRNQLGFRLSDMQNARFSDFNKGGRVTGGNPYGNDDPAVSRAIALTREY